MNRTEFGVERTSCSCAACRRNCEYMPGCLIPADLDRLIPPSVVDVLAWAEWNLLASPGAVVKNTRTGEIFRIPTLVPAIKADGSCIHLSQDGFCQIHAVAPFGCAFFDCGPERNNISRDGLMAVHAAQYNGSLYGLIWQHLNAKGLHQPGPEVLRARMEVPC